MTTIAVSVTSNRNGVNAVRLTNRVTRDASSDTTRTSHTHWMVARGKGSITG
jgi:hypothetical protein